MNTFQVEYIHPINDENSLNNNVDINVIIDGVKYFATFFTINNIITLMNSYQNSSECLGGEYFWATNLIIINRIEEKLIYDCIKNMLDDGTFYSAFSRVD